LTQSFAAAGSVAVNSDYNNPATPIGATEQVQFYLQPSFTREDASVGFLGTDVMTPDGFGVGAREGKLRVLLNSTVIRLIWSGNKCIGVEYTSGGQSFKVFAAKEVILSTGIRSPGMLQREGIGDATLLNSLGIPVRVDNPNVGNNMHNHPEWLVLVNAPNAAFAPFGTPFINTIETCAFLPTTIGGTTRSFEIVPIMFNGVPDTIFMATFYVTPESVGTANIQNRDPLKIELADPEYLTNPNDLTNIMAFFTQYFTNLNNYWAANQSPEATTWALASPTAATIADPVLLEQWLRTNLTEAYHWSCMCRMGTNITNSVVDSHCRVWGVDGLRVVDNQSCPVVEDGNTSSTAYLMGESVAEFILAGG
jgi:choline dehydrogenase